MNGIQLARGVSAAGGLWSLSSLARTCRVARQTTTQWVRRHSDFPRPAARVGKSSLWAGEDVLDWLERTERYYSALQLADAVHSARMQRVPRS